MFLKQTNQLNIWLQLLKEYWITKKYLSHKKTPFHPAAPPASKLNSVLITIALSIYLNSLETVFQVVLHFHQGFITVINF